MELTSFGYHPDGEAINEEQVKLCEEWIEKHCKPVKRVNNSYSSYYYKHVVEKEADTYISNGAFIQAAINKGYKPLRYDSRSPNATFNFSTRGKK